MTFIMGSLDSLRKNILTSLGSIEHSNIGVMDIFHAVIGSKAIYCLDLQGINTMNQKTALFVVINIPRRMDVSLANSSINV